MIEEAVKRAIVVEDSEPMRSLIRLVLGSMGIKDVVEAEDGARALERMMAERFDVAVLDWRMPIMDGLECLRRIRRGEGGIDPGLPVLVLTSETGAGAQAAVAEAGADGYLSKPMSLRTLGSALRKILA